MSEQHGRAMRVVGETLLDIAPHEYGHRNGDEPANLEGTPLGMDATRIVMALSNAGLLVAKANNPNVSDMGDWCPTCECVVVLLWHRDEQTQWDVHSPCTTALVWKSSNAPEVFS